LFLGCPSAAAERSKPPFPSRQLAFPPFFFCSSLGERVDVTTRARRLPPTPPVRPPPDGPPPLAPPPKTHPLGRCWAPFLGGRLAVMTESFPFSFCRWYRSARLVHPHILLPFPVRGPMGHGTVSPLLFENPSEPNFSSSPLCIAVELDGRSFFFFFCEFRGVNARRRMGVCAFFLFFFLF